VGVPKNPVASVTLKSCPKSLGGVVPAGGGDEPIGRMYSTPVSLKLPSFRFS